MFLVDSANLMNIADRLNCAKDFSSIRRGGVRPESDEAAVIT